MSEESASLRPAETRRLAAIMFTGLPGKIEEDWGVDAQWQRGEVWP